MILNHIEGVQIVGDAVRLQMLGSQLVCRLWETKRELGLWRALQLVGAICNSPSSWQFSRGSSIKRAVAIVGSCGPILGTGAGNGNMYTIYTALHLQLPD
jgi:hypothetical protein